MDILVCNRKKIGYIYPTIDDKHLKSGFFYHWISNVWSQSLLGIDFQMFAEKRVRLVRFESLGVRKDCRYMWLE